ncbi:uncharacterized protein LOC126235633 [Schistocerca nitens]|uniref:uncharacterized protein LOC126235633 n=1 Tax=Schistocerca nitens TaxID=7011 RepID=UPI0021185AE5|nr:uncharacterized protein LOC126235633 [Schistocerca nitens]
MPYRCCVPNCRGNYDGGPKVTVFKFPEDEATRKKWLSSIRRHNFTPSSSSRVCHVHFHKDDVIWETQIVDERTGQLLRAPLLKPRLRPHAVPSLLPNCPSYLSKEESRREGPEEKKQRLENEQLAAALQYSLASQKDYENTFSFSSLEELMLRTKEVDLPNEWSVIEKHSDFVCFLKIIRNPAPLITHSVVIDSNLNVSLFKKDVQIKTLGKRSFPVIVTNIHEIVSVMQEFSDTDCGHSETSIDSIVEIVKDSLGVLKDSLQESEKEMVDFIYEQSDLGRACGHVGDKVKIKLQSVLQRNPGYSTLCKISDSLSGNAETFEETETKLNSSDLAAFKYAPVTSCEVERSFSRYKAILSDNRRPLAVENLKMHLVIQCNFADTED